MTEGSLNIPQEPNDEILSVLYDGLYRLDTKFGKHRARMRYLQLVRFLTTGNKELMKDENLVYVGGDVRFSKED